MTVKELILALADMPPELKVVFEIDPTREAEIKIVSHDSEENVVVLEDSWDE